VIGSAFGQFCDPLSTQVFLKSFDGLIQFSIVPAVQHVFPAKKEDEVQASELLQESSQRFLAWNLRDSLDKRACPDYVNGHTMEVLTSNDAGDLKLEGKTVPSTMSKLSKYAPVLSGRRQMQQGKPQKYIELLVHPWTNYSLSSELLSST
jgi:hypothetical protein